MKLSNALALLTLACLFASVSAAGEDAPLDLSLTPGMRVRVLAPGISPSKVVGTINKVDEQSVTIDVPGRSAPVSVLREKIARLDVSEGPRSRGVDAAIGAVIGAAMPPGEHWNEMPATRYRVGFAPRLDHGLNLAVAWNFLAPRPEE